MATLKVILRDDVDNVGSMGETVRVAPGYARNYLIPRKLAVLAESASAKQIEHELKIIKKREEKKRAELKDVAKVLETVTVDIQVRAGEGDKLFGSVTGLHIAERLAELGHTVDKKNIKLEEPIKQLGIYTVPVRLGVGVEANIKVWVTGLATESAEAEAAPADAEDDTDEDDE